MKYANPYLDVSGWEALHTFVAWQDGKPPVLFRYRYFIDAWNARDEIKRAYLPWHVTDVYQMY